MRAPLVCLLCCCTVPLSAAASDFTLGVEAGGAAPFGLQRALFDAGLNAAAKASLELSPEVDAELRVAYVMLAAKESSPLKAPGFALTAGPALRIGSPRSGELFYPWLDLGAFAARTGPDNRLGFDAGIGFHFRSSPDDAVWFGLTFRYLRVLALESRPGFEGHDASLFLMGLSAELDLRSPPADRDGDGVPDRVDACPQVTGSPGRTDGCGSSRFPGST